MELWKPIPSNNKYEASTEGRIRNASNGHILKEALNNMGYKMVTLSGGQSSRLVHRLVAETWIDNPDLMPIIEHKDDNPLNCAVDNLMWSTQKANLSREHRKGLINDYHQSDEWKATSAKRVGMKFVHCEEYIDKYLNKYIDTVENYRTDYYNGLSMKDLRKKYGTAFVKNHPLKHTNRRAYMALLQEIVGCNVL